MSENARKLRSASTMVRMKHSRRVLDRLHKGELAMLAALLDSDEFVENQVKLLKQLIADFTKSQFGPNTDKATGGES